MNQQGKTPKQQRDSMMLFELAFWAIVATVILISILK